MYRTNVYLNEEFISYISHSFYFPLLLLLRNYSLFYLSVAEGKVTVDQFTDNITILIKNVTEILTEFEYTLVLIKYVPAFKYDI